ncbi:TolC family protein [Filimonas effusa]|uniref:TolC family protein n=1 Tax=Filimonas effusa TaxID=2508721 RepID=A0A4Q1DAX2_9BACT|nr:TolC family protein [Filimonas effusa]RXK86584.1 TolC family protein [Filimonas effusa]
MCKHIFIAAFLWLCLLNKTEAQSLTIGQCYQLAQKNYPLIKQYAIIDKARDYSLSNASKGYLPQLTAGGQATYQSDVTQVPISLPNVSIPTLSKNQYKLYGEVSQSITDLFTVKYQKELINANTAVETQQTEVELYKLKERINQLYFGILLIDAQVLQTEIMNKDLQSGLNRNSIAITNGIALKSSGDVLKAEMLKTEQHITELKATRKGYSDMLSLFVNAPVNEYTQLVKPLPDSLVPVINRPELRLFAIQKKTFEAQSKLVNTKTLPHFSAFLQGGYGRPALNMLNNDFDVFYIGGLRLSWNLTSFYTYKQEKQLLSLSQHSLDIQKETFLFNTNVVLKQQDNELKKLRTLIESDREIISLRRNVTLSAQNQLEYGIATTNDYVTYVNAEDRAKQDLILHEVQLSLAIYNYKTTTGN